MKKIILSKEQEKSIISDYRVTPYVKTIAKKYKVSPPVIKRILIEMGELQSPKKFRKYSLDENYFSVINTSNKAYWAGFIAADGNVNDRKQCGLSLAINLNIRDKEHLEKLLLDLKSNAPIQEVPGVGYGKGTTLVRLIINSSKLVKDLYKIGIVPRKSMVLQPPIIPSEFYMDFIRGYFDGDGSIYKTKTGYNISFEGTKELLEWILQVLGETAIFYQRRKNNKNHYYFRFGGSRKPTGILQKFYTCPERYLDRKNELVKKLAGRL